MQCTTVALAVAAGGLTGCAIERAQVAHDVQSRIVGLTKEQLLCCMGVRAAKAGRGRDGGPYNPGTTTPRRRLSARARRTPHFTAIRQFATGNAYTTGFGFR